MPVSRTEAFIVAPSFTRAAGWHFVFQKMNWLNINVATLRAPEYIGSDPVARATWLNVIAWCCTQENGGRIASAKGWKDRQWQQICGVTADEINASHPLLSWEGDDLVVWNYPSERQAEIAAKREAGRRGGLRSAASKKQAAVQPSGKAQLEAQLEAETKESVNGKERNRNRNRKGMEVGADGSAPSDAEWLKSLESDPAYVGIHVQREFDKMTAWCAVNRKQASRRRFINWLNRAERPMAAATQDTFGSVRPNLGAW